jgi:hypothetical protein
VGAQEHKRSTADELPADAPLRPGPPTLRQRAGWLVASAVTVAIFVVLLLRVDARGVLQALAGAQLVPLLGAVALSIIIKVLIGADKWRRILAALSCRLSLREATFVRTANAPLWVTPGKAGTVLAAVYLWRHGGLPVARGVSSLLLERLQNLVVLLAFALVGSMLLQLVAPASPAPAPGAEPAEGAASALPAHVDLLFSARVLLVSALCLLAVAVAYAFRRPLYALMARGNLKLANVIRDLASCFHEIPAGRQAGLLLYAAAAQVGELTMGYLIFRAVGVTAPFGAVCVGLALMVVVSNIPVALSGFGLRELTVVYLFQPYGTPAELLAVGVLISAVAYVLPMIIGLPLLVPLVRACVASTPRGQNGGGGPAHPGDGEQFPGHNT